MDEGIKKRYRELQKRVKSDEFYTQIDLQWRVNRYTCSCGNKTDTRDMDAGVTPYTIPCEKCGGHSRSSFYRVASVNPTHEWYRPKLKELLKMNNVIEHVLKGGLVLMKIENHPTKTP